jgi:hypothetical protein
MIQLVVQGDRKLGNSAGQHCLWYLRPLLVR